MNRDFTKSHVLLKKQGLLSISLAILLAFHFYTVPMYSWGRVFQGLASGLGDGSRRVEGGPLWESHVDMCLMSL